MRETDVVANILGGGGHTTEHAPSLAAPAEPDPVPEPAPKPVAKKAEPKPEPKKPVEVADVDIGGFDLGSLDFDE